MKGVYVFLANGFEETEALSSVDILRRGGVDVKTVSIHNDKYVTGAHKVPVVADWTWGEFHSRVVIDGADGGDAMIFPGGMPGTKNLAQKEELMSMAKLHWMEGGIIAAICAAPGLVVSQLPAIKGRKVTCYDGFQDALIAQGAEYVNVPAVADGNLVTGRGPGCAIAFALEVLALLQGDEVAENVRAGLLI